MVCSNCAVQQPLMSQSGGQASTTPLSQRSFSAMAQRDAPARSNHRLQNARVPKFLLIKFNSCFDDCSLKINSLLMLFSPCRVEKRMPKDNIDRNDLIMQLPQWYKLLIEVLHVMRAIHVVVDLSASSGPEGLDSIELILFHACCFTTLYNRHCFTGMDP